MNDKKKTDFESEARDVRQRREIISLVKIFVIGYIITVLAFVGTIMFIFNHIETVDTDTTTETETIEVDGGEGTANYIGNDGDIIYGENNSKTDTNNNP